MPTAYTSLLGLALPVTGELQGTWGQTVNDAITSLLDTAVAGTTTLSTDADVTLTTTTGASNQARQAIILWTANGTTTRNITAPAQSKAYVVINASAGTQSIVIRGVGPTTGVTVAKGEKVLVAWNGSDFVRVAAYGGTGEFTTVDTTNLEVTNVKAKDGTSAATIADSTGVVTFTANPILNGGTANGVLYLNGSKVATSGSALVFDGSNLGIGTASPASAIEVARGAGVAAAISLRGNGNVAASEFLLMQSSDGLTAYVYNRTAGSLVLGTNNLDRMVVNSLGNVGIGTNAPTNYSNYKTLALAGGSNGFVVDAFTSGGINAGGTQIISRADYTSLSAYGPLAGTAAYFAIQTGTYAASLERMRVDGSGNVGIGMVPNSAQSTVQIFKAIGTTIDAALRITDNSSTSLLFGTTASAVASIWTNGALTFGTNSTTITERMRIAADGNVGIGVTPSAWSSDYKAIESSSGSLVSYLTNNLMMPANLYFDGTNWKYKNTGAASMFQQTTGKSIWYTVASGTGGTNATLSQSMELSAAGNLGIGITPSAWAGGLLAMQVSRGAISGNTAEVDITHNANYDSAWKYIGSTFATRYYQINGAHFWQNAASGTAGAALTWTQAMTLFASGGLSVGNTTDPGVSGRISAGSYYLSNANVIGALTVNGTTEFKLESYTGANTGIVTFYTGGAERMRLTSGGRLVVGGTTTSNAAVCTNNYLVGFEVNSATTAYYQWYVNNAPTDKKYWRAGAEAGNGNWYLETVNDAYSAVSTKLTLSNAGTLQLSSAASSGVFAGSLSILSSTDNDVYRIQMGRTSYYLANVRVGRDSASANSYAAYMSFETTDSSQNMLERLKIDSSGNVLAISIGGLGYGTGSGGAVTQGTSRTQGVTLDKTNGAITLFSAAGTTTWQSFTVTNNKVAATDTVIVNQKSGTDLYEIHVTAVAAGSFRISFKTTGGTTTEQPVFNFAVIKAVTA